MISNYLASKDEIVSYLMTHVPRITGSNFKLLEYLAVLWGNVEIKDLRN